MSLSCGFGGPSFHGSLHPRPAGTGNPQWDGNFGESLGISTKIPTGRWGIAQALGLPDAGCEFGACGGGGFGFQDGSPQTSSTVASYLDDFGQFLLFPKSLRSTPLRLFGTHYCGPGGAGSPNSDVDRACQSHDACYDAAHINFGPNIGWGGWTKQQAAAARVCNQALYDAVRQYPNEPGSRPIQNWLRYGGWLGILYPGTSAH